MRGSTGQATRGAPMGLAVSPALLTCWCHRLISRLIIAALHSTCRRYIFVLWFLPFFFFSSPKQQYLLHMSEQYGELWPTSG